MAAPRRTGRSWLKDAMDVPALPRRPWGVLCGVLNVLPGIGTLVAAAFSRRPAMVATGLVQLLFFWTIVGWLWSLLWGALLLVRSEGSWASTAGGLPSS